jgi:hypothetical protein
MRHGPGLGPGLLALEGRTLKLEGLSHSKLQ